MRIIILCLIIFDVLHATTIASCHALDKNPNILFICVDDLKPALGCYGDKLARTPNIDRLAARGIRFQHAYCNQAVCAASRYSLMFGTRSSSSGIYNFGVDLRTSVPQAVSMPQFFKNHGYHTASVGKVFHVGHGNYDDELSWSIPPVHDKMVEYLDPANSAGGKLTREEAHFTNATGVKIGDLPMGHAWEKQNVPDNAYADGRSTELMIKLLQNYSASNQPFFLAFGLMKPHLPLTCPQKYWDMHDPDNFPLPTIVTPPEFAPVIAAKKNGEMTNYAPLTEELLQAEATQRKIMHAYYACVSYIDAQIGKVLAELDRLKLTESTIIVLWSDHGWHLGDHGYWTKHTNYEQATHIPLLIVAPGVTVPGSVTTHLAESVDLYPTLAELSGVGNPQGAQSIDGLSLVPVLKNPAHIIDDHVYHCFPHGGKLGRAIRTARYRLVEWKAIGGNPDTAEFELYDFETDPLESRNLASIHPEIVKQMLQILQRYPEASLPAKNKLKQ